MTRRLRPPPRAAWRVLGVAAAAVLAAGHANATLTLYGRGDFRGASVSLVNEAPDFRPFGFRDRASSLVIEGESWEVCRDTDFRGRCVVLPPGRYRNLASMHVNDRLKSARPVRPAPPPPPPPPPPVQGEIAFYGAPGFQGPGVTLARDVEDFRQVGFDDRASSVIVFEHRWEACDHPGFTGRCVVLQPGRYPDLRAMGLDDRISSVRRIHRDVVVEPARLPPPPQPVYDFRRRPEETVQTVPVDSVHAVYANPQQHCWTEPGTAPSNDRTTGAVVGGLIGGILGHQLGDRGSKDVSTAGGAVAGAVVGSQLARGGSEGSPPTTRCTSVPAQHPDYYDVVYRFNGNVHHVQMSTAPGATIVVNGQGEPRL